MSAGEEADLKIVMDTLLYYVCRFHGVKQTHIFPVEPIWFPDERILNGSSSWVDAGVIILMDIFSILRTGHVAGIAKEDVVQMRVMFVHWLSRMPRSRSVLFKS